MSSARLGLMDEKYTANHNVNRRKEDFLLGRWSSGTENDDHHREVELFEDGWWDDSSQAFITAVEKEEEYYEWLCADYCFDYYGHLHHYYHREIIEKRDNRHREIELFENGWWEQGTHRDQVLIAEIEEEERYYSEDVIIRLARIAVADSTFNPTPLDALVAQLILRGLRLGSIKLPSEIVLDILSYTSYHQVYPRIRHQRSTPKVSHKTPFWDAEGKMSVAVPYLLLPPIRGHGPETNTRKIKAKQIIIQTEYHDTWSKKYFFGRRYKNTWFEASILRPRSKKADVMKDYKTIQPSNSVDIYSFSTSPDPETLIQGLFGFKSVLIQPGWDFVENVDENGQRNKSMWKIHSDITAEWRIWEGKHRADLIGGVDLGEGSQSKGDGKRFLEALKAGDRILWWGRAVSYVYFHLFFWFCVLIYIYMLVV